jgi:hypothetical protein
MTWSNAEMRRYVELHAAGRQPFLGQYPIVAMSCGALLLLQLLLLMAAGIQQTVPVERLFRDTIAVAEEYPGCCHLYDGLFSNLGVLIWWATAAIAGFTAVVLYSLFKNSPKAIAFAAAGALTGWLALDDLFMIHEGVFPVFGLPQYATYLIYAALAAAYVLYAFRDVVCAAPVMCLGAFAFFGASVLIDVFADHHLGAISDFLHANARMELLLDDGFKFLGVGLWFCLHLFAATNAIRMNVARKQICAPERLGGSR